MKGDFSRMTFDPAKRYSRVLQPQGRVLLDADWNEQADIFLHLLRNLTLDLVGPFAAAAGPDGEPGQGFRIDPRRKEDGTFGGLFVLPGRYYVGGIPVENFEEQRFAEMLDEKSRHFFYLDVWERHVTHLEDDLLREVALLGADTTSRSQVVWRVRSTDRTPDGEPIPEGLDCRGVRREWSRWTAQWQAPWRGRLKARARPGTPEDTEPCLVSPEARYRGENQLYRVEIHRGGIAGDGDGPTFKWSADNGSVVFPVRKLVIDPIGHKTTVTLEHLGRDERSGLVQDDWVEVVDGEEDSRDGGHPLLKVESVDADRQLVVLEGEAPQGLVPALVLRRWDHRRGKPAAAGAHPLIEGQWIDLEDGVQIFFEPNERNDQRAAYRPGDYWLIPARSATGDVEWPGPPNAPLALPPRGVEHHFAPLGILDAFDFQDCRPVFGVRNPERG